MTFLVVVPLVAVVLLGLVLVVPRLVRRGDERRAGPATGLGCGHLPILEDRAHFADVLARVRDADHQRSVTPPTPHPS